MEARNGEDGLLVGRCAETFSREAMELPHDFCDVRRQDRKFTALLRKQQSAVSQVSKDTSLRSWASRIDNGVNGGLMIEGLLFVQVDTGRL
jgi:hypothetical protein